MLKQNAPAAASHPSASEELERPNTRVRRLSAAGGPRSRQDAKVQRVLDASLRLNQLRSSAKMHAFLVEAVARLSGAQRVLLVLESDERGPIAASRLPAVQFGGLRNFRWLVQPPQRGRWRSGVRLQPPRSPRRQKLRHKIGPSNPVRAESDHVYL